MSELEYQKRRSHRTHRCARIRRNHLDGGCGSGGGGEGRLGACQLAGSDALRAARECPPEAVPVLAHPRSNRIFAAAHGTAYALWLTAAHFGEATLQVASSVMGWIG